MMELQNKEIQTISSREVAEMMSVRHDNLMNKIEKHNQILSNVTDLKIKVSDLWQLSSYQDSTGRTLKEYQVTKKGCEFLAHKTTGEKGDLFTIRYMNKFNEMEKLLLEQNTPSYMISDPIKRAEQWIKEQKEKQLIEEQKKLIEEKHDNLVHNPKTYTTTEIAKELGFSSATALNKDLELKKIQYKVNGTWVLNAKFSKNDFVNIKQSELEGGRVIYNRRWTGKGREWLINEIYKNNK